MPNPSQIKKKILKKVEWIQNSDFQNSDCYKTATSQNSDCYKTATSQNSDCYKIATVTKQRLLQNGDFYKMTTAAKKYFYIFNENIMLGIYFNKNIFFIFFYKTEKLDFCNARMYRGQTPAIG